MTSVEKSEKFLHFKNFINKIVIPKKKLIENLKKLADDTEPQSLDNILNVKNDMLSIFSDPLTFHVITIQYTSKNVFVQLSDCKGKLKFCYSAGFFFKGKRKTSWHVVLRKVFNLFAKSFVQIQEKAVAVHLINVTNRRWVLQKLKKKFFISALKIYNTFPHNGCRHKKVKRKKFKKLLKIKAKKKKWLSGLRRQIVNLLILYHRRFESCFLQNFNFFYGCVKGSHNKKHVFGIRNCFQVFKIDYMIYFIVQCY